LRPTRVTADAFALASANICPHRAQATERLLAQVELLDHLPVALDFLVLEVVQEFPAPSHELEQPAARRGGVGVDLVVLGEQFDALCEERILCFGGAGVFVVELVLLDYIFLLIRVHNHRLITSYPNRYATRWLQSASRG
jgi:hypothetical protein